MAVTRHPENDFMPAASYPVSGFLLSFCLKVGTR